MPSALRERRDHLGRLLSGGHRRERLHRGPNPDDPNIVYVGASAARRAAAAPCSATITARVRSGSSPSGRRSTTAGAPGTCKYRFALDLPDRLLAARPGHALRRPAISSSGRGDEGSSWEAISPDLTRARPDQARGLRRPDHAGHERRRALRHHLRLRRIAARAGRALGRVATTAWSTCRATTADLAERHAARSARMDADRHDRAVAARPGARSTSPPRATSSTTTAPTSTRPRTMARPGGLSPTGFQAGEISRVIREDPVRPGLLYVGTETGIAHLLG